jgi:hypothetical protein
LDFSFYVFDGIGAFYFQSDRLAGECLDEDLHFVECKCKSKKMYVTEKT